MPRVSVIIPTYNREHYVTKAIDSVLTQRFTDYELIVVDDGSSDGTRGALKRYGTQIRYLFQENAGVSAARNAGIAVAQGEWLAFLDSDDEWMAGYLAAQMQSAERYPAAVAHVTNSLFIFHHEPRSIVHFDEIGMLRKFKRFEEHIQEEKPFRTIVSSSHWFLQPMVMRREVLLESGTFDAKLNIAEDMDVVARLALKGPFSFNRAVLVDIYRRPEQLGNLSSQYMNRGIYSRKSFCRVFGALLERPELTFPERAALCKTLCAMWRALGNLYLMSDRQLDARTSYRKALLVYPSLKALVKYSGTFLPQRLAMRVVRRGVTIVPGDDTGCDTGEDI